MRAVVQRVSRAEVVIDGRARASIGRGLLLLLGIEETDGPDDIEWLAGKLARLRIFSDTDGQMNLSVGDVAGDVIVVSQFTLFASTKKGNRPSWMRAARPETATPLYEQFVAVLSQQLGRPVQTGEFGADMQVGLINDGPVTIIIDSKAKE